MRAIKTLAAALLLQVAVSASAQTLVGITNHNWQYFTTVGGPADGWQNVGFDDSSWLTGRGLFGNDTGYPYPFNSVIAGPSGGGPTTVFFRTHFNWSGSTAGVVLTMTNYLDDGTVIYLNGTEITRFNMPAGPAVYATFAPGTIAEVTPVRHQISLGALTNAAANPLVAGDNVLAASVHNNSATSSDTVFGLSIVASQIVAPCTDNIQPTNRTITVGRTTTFTVVQPAGCGIPAPTLQWYRNIGSGDVAIEGQTGSSLTVTNAQLADAGEYFVRLSGSIVVDSRRAVLTVNNDVTAPVFLRAELGAALNAFRLFVDEPLCVDSGACGSDALFQFNWQIVNIANGLDDLGVATVVITGNTVDFTTSVDRTPGAKYKIVADASGSGISDLSGNFVAPGYSITNLDQGNFKQGVNGYTGVEDTELEQGTANGGPDAVHGTTAFILVDTDNSGGQSQALVRFNNIFGPGAGQIPLGSEVVSAVIRMQHTQANANGNPVRLHRMLVNWSQTVATWNNMNANGTAGIQNDGQEAVVDADYRFDSSALAVPFTLDLDVTTSLQAWSAGQANYGWAFICEGGDGYRFDSSSVATGPELIVTYRAVACTGTPTVVTGPASTSVQEGATVVLSASLMNACGTFQWQKDNVNVVGATGPTLTLSNVQLGDAGAYRLIATNPGGSATTSAATVTVTPNTVRPVLTSAVNLNDTTIVLTFSKALTTATAQNAANYVLAPSVAVSSAVLSGGTTVTVTTASRTFPTKYRLSISGLRDTFGSANLINPNPTIVDLTSAAAAGAYGAYADTWKYWTNNLDGQTWMQPAYNDSAWFSGGGFFGTEPSAATLLPAPQIVTAIPPNSDTANPDTFVTQYFRRQVTLPALAAGTAFLLSHYTDDGSIFYLDGVEIGRYQMPDGTPTFVTRSSGGNGEAALQAFTFTATAGTHTLAVEVHQAGTTTSDIVFGAAISAVSLPTALTITPGSNGTNIVSWTADGSWQLVGSQNVQGNYTPVAGNPARAFNTVPSTNAHFFYHLRHRGQ